MTFRNNGGQVEPGSVSLSKILFYCQTPSARAKLGVDFFFTQQQQEQEPPPTFSKRIKMTKAIANLGVNFIN